MDASFILLFALPIFGLVAALIVVAITPRNVSVHPLGTPHRPSASHHSTGLHR